MRLLHTSDWHIGKTNFGVRRDSDHEQAFETLYAIAKDEQVDLILHTGDLFDKGDPGTEALKVGIGYIERLAEISPIVLVVGNHDSNGLMEVIDALISSRRPRVNPIHIIHTARVKLAAYGMIEMPMGDGAHRAVIAGLPFIRPAAFTKQYQELGAARSGLEFADQLDSLMHNMASLYRTNYAPSRDIRIFAAHLLLQGSAVGGRDRGERALDIEENYGARGASIPVVDYCALGHIHKPQTPPGCPYARYAGSPLAIDFGEAGEDKGAQLVSITPGLPADIKFIPFSAGRPLVAAAVPFNELAECGGLFAGKIVKLTVLLAGPERNVYDRVVECLPNSVIARVIEQVVPPAGASESEVGADGEPLSPPELFASFIAGRRGFEKDRATRYFGELYAAAHAGVDTRIPDVDALQA